MKLFRLLIVAFLLFAAAPVALTRAAADITVDSSTATASFPDGVTFDVKATSSAPIVKAELLYNKAALETLYLNQAKVDPSTSIDVSLPVDFRANYVPPGIDISYRWRLTDANGRTIETDPQVVTWEDTRFDWKQVTTDQVTVYYYTGDKEFAQTILDSAQSTIDRLQTNFSVERSRPIRIWVYDSKSDFQGSQAPNSQDWIAGTAYPELQVILAVLPDGNSREVGRIVPHEISHQVLYQATLNPFNVPPTWMDEGLAVSAQDNGNEDFSSLVERASQDGRLFSVRSLTSEFPYDPADASLAYAESYSIVQFILGRWGNDGIAKIIDAYKQGDSHDQALTAALGVDMTELDKLWKESLGYSGDRGVAGGTSSSTDSSGFDGLILDGTSLILVLAVFASIVAMARRHRSHRHVDDEALLYGPAA
jgi:hypothetical protein